MSANASLLAASPAETPHENDPPDCSSHPIGIAAVSLTYSQDRLFDQAARFRQTFISTPCCGSRGIVSLISRPASARTASAVTPRSQAEDRSPAGECYAERAREMKSIEADAQEKVEGDLAAGGGSGRLGSIGGKCGDPGLAHYQGRTDSALCGRFPKR
jgi:hypothetical protein